MVAVSIMTRFESLGTDGELGRLQSAVGFEPPGALRFCDVPFAGLVHALETGFAALAEPDAITIETSDDGATGQVAIPAYGFRYEAAFSLAGVDRRRTLATEQRRVRLLFDRLAATLRAGERILVRKGQEAADPAARARLLAAIRGFGPAPLLMVGIGGMPGSVLVEPNRLLLGEVRFFAPIDQDSDVEAWASICTFAVRAIEAAPLPGTRLGGMPRTTQPVEQPPATHEATEEAPAPASSPPVSSTASLLPGPIEETAAAPAPPTSPSSQLDGAPSSQPDGAPSSQPDGAPSSQLDGAPSSQPDGAPSSEPGPSATSAARPVEPPSPDTAPPHAPEAEPTGDDTLVSAAVMRAAAGVSRGVPVANAAPAPDPDEAPKARSDAPTSSPRGKLAPPSVQPSPSPSSREAAPREAAPALPVTIPTAPTTLAATPLAPVPAAPLPVDPKVSPATVVGPPPRAAELPTPTPPAPMSPAPTRPGEEPPAPPHTAPMMPAVVIRPRPIAQPGAPAGIAQPAGPAGILQPAGPAGILQPAGPAGILQPAGPAGILQPAAREPVTPPAQMAPARTAPSPLSTPPRRLIVEPAHAAATAQGDRLHGDLPRLRDEDLPDLLRVNGLVLAYRALRQEWRDT